MNLSSNNLKEKCELTFFYNKCFNLRHVDPEGHDLKRTFIRVKNIFFRGTAYQMLALTPADTLIIRY